jgi:hypothetical protein
MIAKVQSMASKEWEIVVCDRHNAEAAVFQAMYRMCRQNIDDENKYFSVTFTERTITTNQYVS